MSAFRPRDHVFVDESKTKGYFVAATAVAPERSAAMDRAARRLTRPGQRRIHFTREKDASRRLLLSRMVEFDVRVQLYVVRGRPDRVARPMCLDALVADLAASGAARVTLERDESILTSDRRTLGAGISRNGCHDRLTFDHASPTDTALLWISDAIAWCHQAGGDWVRRASPIVSDIRELR